MIFFFSDTHQHPIDNLKSKIINQHANDKYLPDIIQSLENIRDENSEDDNQMIISDTQILISAYGGNSESIQNSIQLFLTKSYKYIAIILKRFLNIKQTTVDTFLEQIFAINDKYNLIIRNIVKYALNSPQYFADVLTEWSLADGSEMNAQLISIIAIWRCEIDMQNIKEEFEKINNKSLLSCICDKTSGYYRNTLILLIGESRDNFDTSESAIQDIVCSDRMSPTSDNSSNENSPRATVFPCEVFVIEDDIRNLHEAIKLQNKIKIIDILCHRTQNQRQKIIEKYIRNREMNKNGILSLEKNIDKFGSVEFIHLMWGLVMPFHKYVASTIELSNSFRWICLIFPCMTNLNRELIRVIFQASRYRLIYFNILITCSNYE